jgi:two-component system LytT family sensor kinase
MWRVWNSPNAKLAFKILFNLILWGIWIGLPLLSPVHHPHLNAHTHPHANPEFSEHIWLELATVVPLFYIITLILIPYVFKRKGALIFCLSLVVIVFQFLGIQYLIQNYFMSFDQFEEGEKNLKGIFPLVMIAGIASTYGLLLEFIQMEAEKEEKNSEQMKSELSFLRSQISPHFIFNVLNSIVYLIRTKSAKEAETVTIKLSSLMRYMLYDSDQSMVPLSRELEYLTNYIDLQKTRFEDDVKIQFADNETIGGLTIEPMLLIPFVENAFKHGIGNVIDPTIQIDFKIKNKTLEFKVQNKIGNLLTNNKDTNSGIGLKNVRRRLEMLYPEKHTLEINISKEFFIINLNISLHKNK